LLWGHIRTKLSSGHQQAGATFDIETPNALIGVKFSQPDVEVSYDPEKQETIGVAHTVELIAINLVTNEQITVPVGSTVIIVGLVMKVVSGTTAAAIVAGVAAAEAEIATAATATTTTAARIGKGTMIAIGAGAAVAVGGVALAASSGDGDSSGETSGSGNYTVSDLEGTWVGAWPVSFTFSVPMPVPFPVTEIPIAFVFDAQGNATNWEFSGFISRDCEKFRVSPSGEVSGTCYSEGIFEGLSVNWTYNFQGHFTSQDSMDMRLNGVGTGTETGTSVTVSCTGSGTLTHYK
jgi:hypothetical protein